MRFPGFEERYRLYSFEDIFLFSTGKNIKQNEASPVFETPCVRYGELYHLYNEVINEVINKTNLDKSELIFSKGDEILLPSAGEDPLDIGSASALTIEGVAIGRTINILRPSDNNIYSNIYVSYYINQKLRKKISTLAKGVSISNVYNSDLRTLEIILPSLSEQKRIVLFLSLLNDRITTQNKIIEELEVLKTTITKEIFSGQLKLKDENGNSFPQWEEKKLGEVANIKSGLSKEQNDNSYGYKVTRIETISDGTINLNKIGHIDFDGNIDDYKIKKGDILFSNINSVSHIGKTAIAYCDLDLYHGMNLLCIKSKYGLDPLFLYYYLNTVKIRNYFKSICNQAVSQASINQTELAKTIIVLPSLKEQTKIATFLRFICSKIDIEVQLLNQLEDQKKFLLEQMFV